MQVREVQPVLLVQGARLSLRCRQGFMSAMTSAGLTKLWQCIACYAALVTLLLTLLHQIKIQRFVQLAQAAGCSALAGGIRNSSH